MNQEQKNGIGSTPVNAYGPSYRRFVAKDVLAKGERIRMRMRLVFGLCLGLAIIVAAFD